MGFAGDCGYNQLLYPVAEQSRVLLAWIVDKLPKSEEERVEEALGANALLSKKIRDSLVLWKSIFWHPSFCCDTLLKNRYHNHELRTVKFASHIRKYPTAIEVYKSCIIMKHFIDPSIFERHKLEMVHDATYASKLESDFEDGEFNQINDGLDSYNKSFPRGNAEFTGTSIRNSISQAVHRSNTFQSQLNDDSSSSPFYAGGANNPSANNLNDFIISLKNENQRGGFSDVFERKSRFEHAVGETSLVINAQRS